MDSSKFWNWASTRILVAFVFSHALLLGPASSYRPTSDAGSLLAEVSGEGNIMLRPQQKMVEGAEKETLEVGSWNLLMQSLAQASIPSSWMNTDRVKFMVDEHLKANPVHCIGVPPRGDRRKLEVVTATSLEGGELHAGGLIRCIEAVFTLFYFSCPWKDGEGRNTCRPMWSQGGAAHVLFQEDGIADNEVCKNADDVVCKDSAITLAHAVVDDNVYKWNNKDQTLVGLAPHAESKDGWSDLLKLITLTAEEQKDPAFTDVFESRFANMFQVNKEAGSVVSVRIPTLKTLLQELVGEELGAVVHEDVATLDKGLEWEARGGPMWERLQNMDLDIIGFQEWQVEKMDFRKQAATDGYNIETIMRVKNTKPDLTGDAKQKCIDMLVEVGQWEAGNCFISDTEGVGIMYKSSKFDKIEAGRIHIDRDAESLNEKVKLSKRKIAGFVVLKPKYSSQSKPLLVINAHLMTVTNDKAPGFEGSVRARELTLLRQFAKDIAVGMDVILMGDFNTNMKIEREQDYFAKTSWDGAPEGMSFQPGLNKETGALDWDGMTLENPFWSQQNDASPAKSTNNRFEWIDVIFSTADITGSDVNNDGCPVCSLGGCPQPSDHIPLTATVSITTT